MFFFAGPVIQNPNLHLEYSSHLSRAFALNASITNELIQVNLRTKGYIGVSGDRCGSGVEWVPYNLDDGADSGAAGGGGEQEFTSWRRRAGIDPIVAGPHWEEVEQKLQATGVDFWWDPRQEEEVEDVEVQVQEEREPEARAGPVLLGEEQNRAGTHADVKQNEPADSGDGDSRESKEGTLDDKDGADGENNSKVRGGKVGAWGDAVEVAGAAGAEQVRPSPLEGEGKSVAEVAAAAVASAVAAKERGGVGGRSWVFLVVLLLCTGVAGIGCMGRKKTKRRRGGAKRRKQVTEWSGNAFSTNTLSPLGGAKTAATFGWTGPMFSKHHQV